MSTTISPAAPEAVKEEAKPKRKVNRKALYELPEGTKLEVTPEDFDPDKFRMTKAQFISVPNFMEHQAWVHTYRAAKLCEAAAEYRLNPPKSGGTKKALLIARLGKLEAKLAELGVNVEDLFADEDSE